MGRADNIIADSVHTFCDSTNNSFAYENWLHVHVPDNIFCKVYIFFVKINTDYLSGD